MQENYTIYLMLFSERSTKLGYHDWPGSLILTLRNHQKKMGDAYVTGSIHLMRQITFNKQETPHMRRFLLSLFKTDN